MLVAGFFVRDIPVGLAWLKYFSFVFYGYSLLQKAGHSAFAPAFCEILMTCGVRHKGCKR